MNINETRLIEDLNKLRENIGPSYSGEDLAARYFISDVAKEYGFAVKTDGIGNMLIIPQGSEAKFLIGAHLDAVTDGEWQDAVFGVAAGLEVLRTFEEARFQHDGALVIFAEEAGANSGLLLAGSRYIAGTLKAAQLDELKNNKGESLKELIAEIGYDAGSDPLDLSGAELLLELHMEPGASSENEQKSLGIVDVVYGQQIMEVEMTGEADHTGSVSMKNRKDALMSACSGIARAEQLVCEEEGGTAVITVGDLSVTPEGTEMVSEECRFALDIRDADTYRIDRLVRRIQHVLEEEAENRNVECNVELKSDFPAVPMSSKIVRELKVFANSAKMSHNAVNIGSIHDVAVMAGSMETAMIVVSADPSEQGPEDEISADPLIDGAEFLMHYMSIKAGK